jgi:uncharacterized protein YjbI with pentapeptide repeats
MLANLQEAFLANAKLQRVNFANADLQRAHLRGAKLQEAYLGGAKLQGADFRDTDLTVEQLDGALWDQTTQFSRDLDLLLHFRGSSS